VDQVNSANQEQARGVEQVAEALGQMGRVMQTSAVSSEQSAATSEELKSQSEAMKQIAGELRHGWKKAGVSLLVADEACGTLSTTP
jgi:methyl-accepting chemotaxis protein